MQFDRQGESNSMEYGHQAIVTLAGGISADFLDYPQIYTQNVNLMSCLQFFQNHSNSLLFSFQPFVQYLAKKFEKHKVGILELPHLTEQQLKHMKIPAGPRMRILHELETMQQHSSWP